MYSCHKKTYSSTKNNIHHIFSLNLLSYGFLVGSLFCVSIQDANANEPSDDEDLEGLFDENSLEMEGEEDELEDGPPVEGGRQCLYVPKNLKDESKT